MDDNSINHIHGIENLPNDATQRGASSEKNVEQAMERYSNASVSLFFNRKERLLVQKKLVAELDQGFEYRQKSLSMALETRLHSIREACNHVLVTGKTHLRQNRLEYFGEVLKQVESQMGDFADSFLSDTDERFKRLESFSSEVIKNREKQRLEKSVDDFLGTLELLMDEFRNIIHENIEPQAGVMK